MKAVAIIPARYASSRLPGKPLLAQTGKTLIQHVVEAVMPSKRIDTIVVATDDSRIADAVKSFGGQFVMTSVDCRSGTDRAAEAAESLGLADDDIVVNVQGDEPEIPAEYVDKLIELLDGSQAPMATLATAMPASEAGDPSKVKVVCDSAGLALYFSRSRIPHDRDASGGVGYLLHLGIYAYRVGFLKQLAELPATAAERSEKLEQLRVLEHGHRIAVGVVETIGAAGIDTPEDYEVFVERFRASETQ